MKGTFWVHGPFETTLRNCPFPEEIVIHDEGVNIGQLIDRLDAVSQSEVHLI